MHGAVHAHPGAVTTTVFVGQVAGDSGRGHGLTRPMTHPCEVQSGLSREQPLCAHSRGRTPLGGVFGEGSHLDGGRTHVRQLILAPGLGDHDGRGVLPDRAEEDRALVRGQFHAGHPAGIASLRPHQMCGEMQQLGIRRDEHQFDAVRAC